MTSTRLLFSAAFLTLWLSLATGTLAQIDAPAFRHPDLEELFASPKFVSQSFQGGRWADEGPVITYIETLRSNGATHLMSYNLETQQRDRLIDGRRLQAPDVDRLIGIHDYAYSPAKDRVLIYTDSEQVWRDNTKGFYYLYEAATASLVPLSNRDLGFQMFAKFSPDGRHVGFVRDRNLFLVELATMTETQLTFDGADGGIINGTFDWVYEEEFYLQDGWSWSPDSRHIAFFQLDESATREFVMADLRSQYPELFQYRYPKAGEQNSEVRIGVITVADGAARFFETGTWFAGENDYEYIARMGWTPPMDGEYRVWMFRLNRDQNVLDLLHGFPDSGEIRLVKQEQEPTWIEVSDGKLTYLNDDQHFVWMSEVDGYRHLYLYRNDGYPVRRITEGSWEVTDFHGVDERNNLVYFTATIDDSIERHLYRTALRPRTARAPEKITTEGGWHMVNMSSDLRYYIDIFSSAETPPVTTLHHADGRQISVLEENAALRQTLREYTLPPLEFTTVPAADGTPLNAYILRPSYFDSTASYPLLMHVYGGPGHQNVRNIWGGIQRLWHQKIADENGIIVVSVDNRGTGGRGKAFKSITYRRLGVIEAEDQIAAAHHLRSLPYVDQERVGIWGWSYGGYMTLLSMLYGDGPQTFTMGVAVAPVTDWSLYDTIYTERYMSTPQLNPEGYRAGAPVTMAGRLQDHQRVLIVHGDYDDNVHFQHALQMANAFQSAGKQFDLMVYPGRNHGIYGGRTRLHLYTLFTNYIERNL